MPTPTNRTPLRVARGTYTNLNNSVSDIQEGEVCYATDQDRLYVKESGSLVSTQATIDPDTVVSDVSPTFTATVQTTERTITSGAFDLATGNHWTCGAITVPAPTNAVAGTSGLIRMTAGPVTWNTVFKFPGGAAPTVNTYPAIIPFYVENSTTILMGNVAEGIA